MVVDAVMNEIIDGYEDLKPWTYYRKSYDIYLTECRFNLSEYVGFVYQINEISTGMKYIGIKKLWKKKRNKRREKVQSDWRTYNSSCEKLVKKMEDNPADFEKVIIRLCSSVSEMKAYEAYIQLEHYFCGMWDQLYNEMVHLRVRLRKES